MTAEERLRELEQENRLSREQLAHRDELIAQLHLRLHQQEERIMKISHNTHLPPRIALCNNSRARARRAGRSQVGSKAMPER